MSRHQSSNERTWQIWSYNFTKKWVSNDVLSNSEITVRSSERKQPWKVELELAGEERLWNIFVEQGPSKLFASYEFDDDRVTLQEEGDRQKSFILGVATNGLFLIKTNEKLKNRFLKKIGEKVKVVEVLPGTPLDQSFGWDIAEPDQTDADLIPRLQISRDVTVNLAEAFDHKQWSHVGLSMGDQIPVRVFQPSHQQYWRMEAQISRKGEAVLNFSIVGNDNSNRFAVTWNNNQVLLGEKSENQTGKGTFYGIMRSNGFILKTDQTSGKQFIGVTDGKLTLQTKSRAKVWFPEPIAFA